MRSPSQRLVDRALNGECSVFSQAMEGRNFGNIAELQQSVKPGGMAGVVLLWPKTDCA